MNPNLINTIILATSFLALFGFAEILYRKFRLRAEITRKVVHIGTGLLTLLFPLMLSNHWWVLFLCASFAVILLASLKFNFLPSINAIGRDSVGSLAYPVSVYTAYWFYDHYNKDDVFFYLPILILAIADPIAALAGKRWPKGNYTIGATSKTLTGAAGFFIAAFVSSMIVFNINYPDTVISNIIIKSLIVAFVSCAAEALTGKGYDNIAIPLTVLGTLIVFEKTLSSF